MEIGIDWVILEGDYEIFIKILEELHQIFSSVWSQCDALDPYKNS